MLRGEKYYLDPFHPDVMKHLNAAERMSGKRPTSFYEALHAQDIKLPQAKSILNALAEKQHLDYRLSNLGEEGLSEEVARRFGREGLPPLEKFRRAFVAAKLREYQKYRAQQP